MKHYFEIFQRFINFMSWWILNYSMMIVDSRRLLRALFFHQKHNTFNGLKLWIREWKRTSFKSLADPGKFLDFFCPVSNRGAFRSPQYEILRVVQVLDAKIQIRAKPRDTYETHHNIKYIYSSFVSHELCSNFVNTYTLRNFIWTHLRE